MILGPWILIGLRIALDAYEGRSDERLRTHILQKFLISLQRKPTHPLNAPLVDRADFGEILAEIVIIFGSEWHIGESKAQPLRYSVIQVLRRQLLTLELALHWLDEEN